MSSQEKRPFVLTSILDWCRGRIGAGNALPRSKKIPCAAERTPPESADHDAPATAGYFFDGGLLFHCMDKLQIDRSELDRDDPLLFRELQGRCSLCRDRLTCAAALAHEFDDAQWEEWRKYCPNAPTLDTIGAVQNCSRAAQSLKTPRPTRLSRRR
jgi:hypothetical protein